MARTDTGVGPLRHGAHGNLFRIPGGSIGIVLRWQLAITALLALAAAYIAGMHGALSAGLGGAISVVAGLVFVVVAGKRKVRSAEAVLFGALRAEGAKIAAIVLMLWLVLSLYTRIVTGAFLASFIVTVIISSLAFFVRET